MTHTVLAFISVYDLELFTINIQNELLFECIIHELAYNSGVNWASNSYSTKTSGCHATHRIPTLCEEKYFAIFASIINAFFN
jgi:hypothetical protein